ncbi:unnamed protein product [Prorocentrum cordatum]|uniref:SWIM-type domain-containing protein n=1 Tax=Prorocentrum cordatum TaxID=2364126 RepID=A0ABN9Q8A4_9DINO|nr:unnamed protein product [Polarella glacialis]
MSSRRWLFDGDGEEAGAQTRGAGGGRPTAGGGSSRQERLQAATSKLILWSLSRGRSRHEVLASGGLVAACQQSRRSYDKELKDLEEKGKNGEKMWEVIRRGEMLEVARACPCFRLKIFRKGESAPQKGAFYMKFHRDSALCKHIATLMEQLVIMEGSGIQWNPSEGSAALLAKSEAGQPPRRLGRHAAVAAVLGALVVLATAAFAGRSMLHDGRVQLSRVAQGAVVLEVTADAASGAGVQAVRDNVTELQTQMHSLEEAAGPASAAAVQALKDNITELQSRLSYLLERFPAEVSTSPVLMPVPAPTVEDASRRPLGPNQKYCGALPIPVNATCCNGIAGAPFSTCCAGKIVCGMLSTCCGNICCSPGAVCCNGICGAPNAICTANGILLAPMIKPTESPRSKER